MKTASGRLCLCGNRKATYSAQCHVCRKSSGWRPLVHGDSRRGAKTPEYRSWVLMRRRCEKVYDECYPRYGGRGITVCDRWRLFDNFLQDMGRKPSPKHTLGRIDNDQGYGPGNCRWEDRYQQAKNRRTVITLTYQGESLCIAEWARKLGIQNRTLQARLYRGWPVERVLGEKIHGSNPVG